jgi:chaperonin cofactor prefoldin
MGLAASEGRYMFLSQRKNDIEFKLQVLNQRRTVLAYQASQLARTYANSMYQNDNPNTNPDGTAAYTSNGAGLPGDLLFDSATAQPANNPVNVTTFTSAVGGTLGGESTVAPSVYEAQMATVQAMDKELELRAKDLEVQGKEIDAEVEAVKKVIDKAIERTYKIGA